MDTVGGQPAAHAVGLVAAAHLAGGGAIFRAVTPDLRLRDGIAAGLTIRAAQSATTPEANAADHHAGTADNTGLRRCAVLKAGRVRKPAIQAAHAHG